MLIFVASTMIVDELFGSAFMSLVAGLLTAFVGLISSAWITRRFREEKREAETELERIATTIREERGEATEKERIENLLKHELGNKFTGNDKAVINLTNLIVDETYKEKTETAAVEALISGYHEQALSQSSTQFWFSVVAATIGFAWIIYSGLDIQADNLATVLKIIPGVVMDAVAFLFFKQAAETRQRATDLYDRLRKDKLMSDSIVLVSSIEDIRVRSAVKAQMALHMTGLEPSPIDLTRFLTEGVAPKLIGKVAQVTSPKDKETTRNRT